MLGREGYGLEGAEGKAIVGHAFWCGKMNASEFEVRDEIEDFGGELGCIPIFQLSQADFNDACYSKNRPSEEGEVAGVEDSTGKRFYSGTYVVLRFFHRLRRFMDQKRVVEIGCGTGIVGAVIGSSSQVESMVITDGNPSTLEKITKRNVARLCSDYSRGKVHVCQLYWPPALPSVDAPSPSIAEIFNKYNNNSSFDVVLGSELMYYTTDIPQLFSTVRQLTSDNGVFLHGHVFRRTGQIDEWIEETAQYGYTTVEVLPPSLLTEEELKYHPEWWKVRVLVTARVERMSTLLSDLQNQTSLGQLKFVPFQEEQWEEDHESSNNQSAIMPLISLFD